MVKLLYPIKLHCLKENKTYIKSIHNDIKRNKTFWSQDEIDELKRGIEKFGRNWILIKNNSKHLRDRKTTDLHDKYRLMNKKSSYYKSCVRQFIEVADFGKYKMKSTKDDGDTDEKHKSSKNNLPKGNISSRIYKDRFPSPVAKRISKFKEIGDIIRISDIDCMNEIHEYEVVLRNGKITVKKLKVRVIN
ncbi:hypothetical protein DMUE_5587 [Dictyocoela muelleri]|nr:hypothetical protein DMUE_5587 [Dictyocoela muelleri]